MKRLEGKVAIITGAAQGMGETHGRMFAAAGAKVVLSDIDETGGEKLARQLGDDAMFCPHDVTSAQGWVDLVKTTEDRFGPITTLVNNAGIIGAPRPCADLDGAEFERICNINLNGVFLGMKYVIPSMLRAGGGSIINISSISGIVAIHGTPNVAYAASKFAVRGITKQVAVEYGKQGIRANSIHPGYIKTRMLTDSFNEEELKAASASVPVGRPGDPEEVSQLAIYLASDESRFTTGTEHIIDGGLTAV